MTNSKPPYKAGRYGVIYYKNSEIKKVEPLARPLPSASPTPLGQGIEFANCPILFGHKVGGL